jgi:putative membrane-bound dehydrogenase-like protein
MRTAIFILSVGTLAVAQPIRKNGDCTGLTPRVNASSGENWNQSWATKPPTSEFPANTYQPPLTPQQSINCVETPPDLVPEIIAHEGISGCNPGMHYLMYFTFDERGRVWAVDARDYPNTINSNRTTGGQGRILILEDTNGDGALNSCKEFYKGLVVPTSVEVVKGGVVVSVHPNICFIPNNNDVGGTPQQLYSGNTNQNYDTHGGINSLMYSLDNWVYGHTGAQFNGGNAFTVDGANAAAGRTWRFRNTAIGNGSSGFQVWTTGDANAHGIGQREDGNIFQSTATSFDRTSHSIRRGVKAVSLISGNGNSVYHPITNDLYLWEGKLAPNSSRTATSGHDFYTARLLPAAYNNRFYMCDGSYKMCHQDGIEVTNTGTRAGSFTASFMTGTNGNIIASKDAWFAPLKVRTGPDGALWVLDWYNYLFLHNPAGPGGAGGAWCQSNSCNTPGNLRTKTRSRIYRLLPANGQPQPYLNLGITATEATLVNALSHTNFMWRLQAQKQLIYRATLAPATLDQLEDILTTQATPDAMGNDPAATHAIWVLEGRGLLSSDATRWSSVVQTAMGNSAWATRRNIVQAMPRTAAYGAVLHASCAVNDDHSQVRLQAMVTIQEGATAAHHPMATSLDIGQVTAARTAANINTNATRPCTPTTTGLPARPAVSIASSRADNLPDQLRYSLKGNGIELGVNMQLPSGELVVYDLRGQVAFRSSFKDGQWSQASVRDLKMPVYFYTYRSIDGRTLKGQIPMTGNL